MTEAGFTLPSCRCAFEREAEPVKKNSSGFERPVDDSILEILPAINFCTDPDQEVEVYLTDVHRLLAQLETRTSTRALHNDQLMSALACYCPGDPTLIAAESTKCFFDSMRLYFDRTLHESGHRIISVQQLRRELDVYVWTMLDNWIRRHCDEDMVEIINSLDMREYRQITYEAPGAVSKMWQTCLDEVVGLIVWQDEGLRRFKAEEVRQSNAKGKVAWCVAVCLGLYALAAVVATFATD